MSNDITNHDPTGSPPHDNDENGNGSLGIDATRGTKRARPNGDDDDDDDEKGGKERRKIDIKFIQDKSRRHITFSKRKAGIMKKVSFCMALGDEDSSIRVRVSTIKNTD
jgi:MADS-box transcription factor